MIKRFIAVVLGCALTITPSSPLTAAPNAACQPPGGLSSPASGVAVEQICYNAGAVERIGGVDMIDPSGRENTSASLALRQGVPVKTTMLVPEATYVDLVSEHANRIRARHGTRTTIVNVASNGEQYGLDGLGGAGFIVQNALNFFRVNVGRFTAAVHGTIFDVDLANPATVTFSVNQGVVSVTRLVSIQLNQEQRTVDNIRVTEYITAGKQITYGRAAELWMTFPNAQAARDKFNKDLATAQSLNDALLEEDARANLARLNAVFPQPKSTQGTPVNPAPPTTSNAVQTIAPSAAQTTAPNATQTTAPNAEQTTPPNATQTTPPNNNPTVNAPVHAVTASPWAAGIFTGIVIGTIVVSGNQNTNSISQEGPVSGTIGLHTIGRRSEALMPFDLLAPRPADANARDAHSSAWYFSIPIPIGGRFSKAELTTQIDKRFCNFELSVAQCMANAASGGHQ